MSSPARLGGALRHPVVRAALRRIPGMVAVWLGFGVVVGLLVAPGSGPIAAAAGVTAGVILMAPLGLLMALVGGRGRDSLVGGALGLALVPAAVWYGGPPVAPSDVVSFALIFGGTVGATAVVACYRLPRLLLSTARSWPRAAVTSNSP